MFLSLVQFTAYVILFYLIFLMFAWPIRKFIQAIKAVIYGSNTI